MTQKYLTVIEALNLSTEYLTSKGIESARINSELLLANVLNARRIDVYLSYDRPLSLEEISLYRSYIRRRANFEPLQYILGKVEFFGLEFEINNSVLIPRQETEILIDTVITNHKNNPHLKLIDIGTGSGNIAISIQKNISNSTVTALDNSESALTVARKNAIKHNCGENVTFKLFDIFDDVLKIAAEKYDVIVSNPPYVAADKFEHLQKEIRLFEPRTAVTDGSDGYKYYRRICEVGNQLLRDHGKLYFEISEGQVSEVTNIFYENGYKNIYPVNDYLNIPRVIYGEKS